MREWVRVIEHIYKESRKELLRVAGYKLEVGG